MFNIFANLKVNISQLIISNISTIIEIENNYTLKYINLKLKFLYIITSFIIKV